MENKKRESPASKLRVARHKGVDLSRVDEVREGGLSPGQPLPLTLARGRKSEPTAIPKPEPPAEGRQLELKLRAAKPRDSKDIPASVR